MSRSPYPSDLSNDEWKLLKPLIIAHNFLFPGGSLMKVLCKICCSILIVVLLTFGSFIKSTEMSIADEICDFAVNKICDFAVNYRNKSSIRSELESSTHEIAFKVKEEEAWDGKLWITGQNYDQIVAIDTKKLMGKEKNKAFSSYPMPKNSGPHGIGFDKEGYLWVTLEFAGEVIRLDPKEPKYESVKTIKYDVKLDGCMRDQDGKTDSPCSKINTNPHGLAISSDGQTVWYTGKATGTLGRIKKDGIVEPFPISKVNDREAIVGSVPIYIKPDSNGNMWFTELVGNAVGCIKQNMTIEEFKIPTSNSRPIMIVEGPNHKNMWFTEEAGNKVGRIPLNIDRDSCETTACITEFKIPKPQDDVILAGLAFDKDHNLWVQQYVDKKEPDPSDTDYLIKIDKEILKSRSSNIDNISFDFYKIPTRGTVMHRIDLIPDGNLWFTELKTDKVGLLSLPPSDTEGA